MIRKKILLLGNFSVGKTSLIRRYVDGTFDDKYLTTIGVKISKKICTIETIEYELLIWDIEGETPIKKIPSSYYKGASGAIFVADSTRQETVDNLWVLQKLFLDTNPQAKHVIAYNKSDLLSEAEKSQFSLDEVSFFTSAKMDINVENLFLKLIKEMSS
ncbi:Mll3243 protein [hydrothermal vent metagenome]|uniref:Mll3243 protein n=1 Tax=hydrothermal vent metagenome TaxID=652676 RepID=A0A1W1CF54_9ZZZZ